MEEKLLSEKCGLKGSRKKNHERELAGYGEEKIYRVKYKQKRTITMMQMNDGGCYLTMAREGEGRSALERSMHASEQRERSQKTRKCENTREYLAKLWLWRTQASKNERSFSQGHLLSDSSRRFFSRSERGESNRQHPVLICLCGLHVAAPLSCKTGSFGHSFSQRTSRRIKAKVIHKAHQ